MLILYLLKIGIVVYEWIYLFLWRILLDLLLAMKNYIVDRRHFPGTEQ